MFYQLSYSDEYTYCCITNIFTFVNASLIWLGKSYGKDSSIVSWMLINTTTITNAIWLWSSYTTTHVIKTKKSVMNCAFWLELTQNYRNFWTYEWIFCWNIHVQCLTIYIGDRYFFRYGHVRSDTNINPQVPVFDINREPVPAPTVPF